MNILNIPSPNFTTGRRNNKPEAIVIHVMEGTLSGTDSWFKNPASKVSAHYGIGKKGDIHNYVPEMNTAWHAGRVNAPSWALIKSAGKGLYVNPNLYTIGIEHEGNETSEWTEEMYQASADLIKDIAARWSIPIDRSHIIGHHEIYSLKTCPGFRADINKLITLAGGGGGIAAAPSAPVTIPVVEKISEKSKVTTKTRLNIRSQPNTVLNPVNTIEPNVQLAYDGYTVKGEAIKDNSKWYYTDEGNWFWSGAVSTVNEASLNAASSQPAVVTGGGDFSLQQIKAATCAKMEYAEKFLSFITDTCARFQINTPIRRLCFLAQVGHESGGLFYTEELASGQAYEGRQDLGNTHAGDGVRYKGRGLIQITGRANYSAISKDLNIDFITNHTLLGGKKVTTCSPDQLKYAALSAGWFWNKKDLNKIADKINVEEPIDEGDNLEHFITITKRINGGINGLTDRLNRYRTGIQHF